METAIQNKTAFFGDPVLKQFFMDRIEGHRKADELIHGVGWGNGKGCAIGCLFHRYDHKYGEEQSGIPRAILRLMDGLFESLPDGMAQAWPERCLSAIKPGADLSLVMAKWFVWMLVDATDGVLRFAETANQRAAIEAVAALYARQANGEDVPIFEFRKAADAYAAAYATAAAYSAALYARQANGEDVPIFEFRKAAAAYAAAYATAAAYSAALYARQANGEDAPILEFKKAAYAADAADAAAYAAAAAYSAAAYSAAAYAACSQAHAKQADKLIELLEAA